MISFSQLTKSDYDSLSSYMPDRLYFLSDTGEIKLNGVGYGGSKQEEPEEEDDYLTFTAEKTYSTVALAMETPDDDSR